MGNKLKNYATLLFTVIITYGIIELVFIFYVPHNLINKQLLFIQPDKGIGYKMKSNVDSHIFANGFDYYIRTDKYGFFNNNSDYDNPELVVIGDSFVAQTSIPMNDKFFRGTGRKTLSLAIGGYQISNYYWMVSRVLPNYVQGKPKYVVVSFFSNDLRGSRGDAPLLSEQYEGYKKQYIESQYWGNRTLFNRVISYIKEMKRINSKSVQIDNGLYLYEYRGAPKKYFEQSGRKSVIKHTGWLAKALNKMRVPTLFLFIPSKESVYHKEHKKHFPESKMIINEKAGFEDIIKIGSDYGFETLDLTEPFRKDAETSHIKRYYDNDPHWNKNGHELARKYFNEAVSKMAAKYNDN